MQKNNQFAKSLKGKSLDFFFKAKILSNLMHYYISMELKLVHIQNTKKQFKHSKVIENIYTYA